MGICGSKDAAAADVSPEQQERARQVEKQLRQDEKVFKNTVKLLLLGSGDSGKSTIQKQFRILNARGFDQQERENFRQIVFLNLIESMRLVVEAMRNLEIALERPECEVLAQELSEKVPEISRNAAFPVRYYEVLSTLWSDKGIQQAKADGHRYALHDSMDYFYSDLNRLFAPDYTPTDQDILRARAKTTGITEIEYTSMGKQFKVVDVGGQRSERRKWVHCFEDVTAIIFVVSMGGYDEGMIEDHSTNQMLDAYEMFTAITASRWFTNTTFILFLNKYDVFQNKIKTRDLKEFFPRYEGPAKDVDAAGEWIRKMFQSCDRRPGASIYTTFTTATDTDLVKRLMPAVNDQILRSNLREAAFI